MQNKRIVFAILIVIFFVFCASSQEITENVQTDSLPQYSMSEIVIIGEKLPDIKFSSIHEIGAKQISVLDIKNAHEALKYSPGIYFSRTSKNETSFRLRGFEQRQVSVFLDGVPISIPYG